MYYKHVKALLLSGKVESKHLMGKKCYSETDACLLAIALCV